MSVLGGEGERLSERRLVGFLAGACIAAVEVGFFGGASESESDDESEESEDEEDELEEEEDEDEADIAIENETTLH